MNVYDFDGTIYDGDSTADFIKYCAVKYPASIRRLPVTAWAFFLYVIGIYTKTRFKEKMYGFLKYIPDGAVGEFWKTHKRKIKDWYYEKRTDNDVVISASPEFLLKPVCAEIGIKKLIASEVDPKTGKYTGENCRDREKVRRLYEWESGAEIDCFYSDSYADAPLAELAGEAYMVKGDRLYKWNEYEKTAVQKAAEMFLSREFIMFLIVGAVNTLSNIAFSTIYSLFIPSTTLAFLPGYISSNILSYLLNSKLTFKERLGFVKYIKFFISYIPNFIIQSVIVYLYERFIHGPSVIAYAAAAVIGIPVTFLFMKVFAFRKKKK